MRTEVDGMAWVQKHAHESHLLKTQEAEKDDSDYGMGLYRRKSLINFISIFDVESIIVYFLRRMWLTAQLCASVFINIISRCRRQRRFYAVKEFHSAALLFRAFLL